MNNLTLKHLRYFDALARHMHFGRAASHCAISQPALSIQIKELEEILSQTLVERGPRQVSLTAFGESFVLRAREVLRSVDELADLARSDGGPLEGKLRLGVIPTIAPYLLPKIVKELARRYPGLDVHPRETMTHKLVDSLTEGRLDAAILALPISEPSLEEIELFEEEFFLVRPMQDRDKPVPESDSLREMRLLLLEEGHCFRDQALSFCKLSAAPPSELMEGNSLTTLVQMVGAGIGVTLIPEMAIDIEGRSAPVSITRLAPPQPTRTIGMVWRRTNPLSSQFQQIAEVIRLSLAHASQ